MTTNPSNQLKNRLMLIFRIPKFNVSFLHLGLNCLFKFRLIIKFELRLFPPLQKGLTNNTWYTCSRKPDWLIKVHRYGHAKINIVPK